MPGRTVAYVALCLFLVSWFVPVHEVLGGRDGNAFGACPTLGFEAGTPPGWRAFRSTWDMLGDEWKDWRNPVLGATSLTNGVMLLAVLALAARRRPRWLGLLLLACAVLNAGWLYLLVFDDLEFVKGLEVGYFVWTISFVLAGLAFLRGTSE